MTKITKDQILKGKNHRAMVPLTAYGGLEVEVRPITDVEMETIFRKLEEQGIFVKQDESVASKLALFREVAKIGTLDTEVAESIDDLRGNAVSEIGMKIVEISSGSYKDVENFSPDQKA